MPENTLRSESDDLFRSPVQIALQMFDEQLENAVAQLHTMTKDESTEWLNKHCVTLKELRDAIES